MEIIRKELTPAEVTPKNTRYNPGTDTVETTWDDGATWATADGYDPRTQAGYLLPPRAGTDKQCDAAANMVAVIRNFVDTLSDAAGVYAVANLLMGLIGLFLPLGLIVGLVVIVAEAIVTIGVTLLQAAMTEEVYDQLLCLFRCACDGDGRMNETSFALLYTRVEAEIEPTAAGFIERILDLVGYVGLTNMGATGSIVGDCSSCDECTWCYVWDFTASDGGFVGYRGDYAPGAGWTFEVGTGFVAATIYGSFDGVYGASVTHWEAEMTMSGVAGNAYVSNWYLTGSTTFNPIAYMDYDGVPTYPGYGAVNGSALYTYDGTGAYPGNNLGLNGVVNDEGAQVVITGFRVYGTGTPPAFTGGSLC